MRDQVSRVRAAFAYPLVQIIQLGELKGLDLGLQGDETLFTLRESSLPSGTSYIWLESDSPVLYKNMSAAISLHIHCAQILNWQLNFCRLEQCHYHHGQAPPSFAFSSISVATIPSTGMQCFQFVSDRMLLQCRVLRLWS